jgi:hypothetical protein
MVIEEIQIMPSLFDASLTNSKTNVAANYGKMSVQQTYGTGLKFTNFGTRTLRVIKINATGTNLTYQNGTNSNDGDQYAALSKYSLAIRALQTVAEIYAVFPPTANDFVAIIADDTANDSEDGSNAVASSGGAIWGDAEKIIADNLGAGVTVTISNGAFSGQSLSWATTA